MFITAYTISHLMTELRRVLVGEVSAVSTLVFTVGIYLYSNLPGPGHPSLVALVAGIAAAIVAVLICVGLLLSSISQPNGRGSGKSDENRSGRDGDYHAFTAYAFPIAALAVVIVLILVLATVPVAHEYSYGPQQFPISFAVNYGTWNHTVSMGGFGEVMFNWSEVGQYNQLHVSMLTDSGSILFSNPATTVGLGGVVVGGGTYYLIVQESASTNTEAYITLETAYTTEGSLLSW